MDDQKQYNRYNELAKKLLDGTITETEKQEYVDWLNREEEPLQIPAGFAHDREQLKNRIFTAVQSSITDQAGPKKHPRLYRYAAAAAIFLVATGVAIYFLINKQPATQTVVASNKPVAADVSPGRDGAVLTLADGKKLLLDSLGNGEIATQGNTHVKIQNGELVYDAARAGGEMLYNTMSTPKGRQFQLLLPDGSKVWLNAASSITYPAAFTDKDRIVQVTGEVYFEVATLRLPAKNGHAPGEKMPFIVKTATQEVEVLGTHFNINAYEDEPVVKTTLLEGSVRISQSATGNRQSAMNKIREVILKPGEQAVLASDSRLRTADSRLTIDHSPDLDEVMAWKNGRFEFAGNSIQSVMRQLSRWYNVDIVYEGTLPEDNFVGAISRQEKLSEVLKMLELTNVLRFKIRQKTASGEAAQIVVMRK